MRVQGQEPGVRGRHEVGPQHDALVEDGVDLAAFEPPDAGRVVRHRLVIADLTAPRPDVVEDEPVRAQHDVHHDRGARVD